ncbi:MAG: UPF0149 family protein [Deltaproteobacteria bacterium]|nr:UPF0149 family protein [Deltaproteobacteria bacterium]
MIKMFTAKEEKNLAYVLSKSADQEDTLFMEELHGLLFGLALTPSPIMPSEWLSAIFPDEPQFDDLDDANTCMGHLFNAYNRLIADFNKGKLDFPFNMKKITDFEHSLIEGWAYGLFLAISLRPDIWGVSDKYDDVADEDLPEDIRDVMDCVNIITAVAIPEERDNIFEKSPDQPAKDPKELQAMLYAFLPTAVEGLREYSALKRKEILADRQSPKPPDAPLRRKKVGPNEPCPCGSGRKYKKCCGSN